jgi:hypothetical protein
MTTDLKGSIQTTAGAPPRPGEASIRILAGSQPQLRGISQVAGLYCVASYQGSIVKGS